MKATMKKRDLKEAKDYWAEVNAIPPLLERLEVAIYLLRMGFSEEETRRFSPFSREYALCQKAMLYNKLKQDELTDFIETMVGP